MIENYEAVLFDLDGTLVDSMWLWHAIDVEYLAGFGLEVPDDLGSAIDGMGFSETAAYFKERFNIPDSIEKIKETWNNMAYEFYQQRISRYNAKRSHRQILSPSLRRRVMLTRRPCCAHAHDCIVISTIWDRLSATSLAH